MKFYRYGTGKNILFSEGEIDLDPNEMIELQPNTTDASGEKHVPVISGCGTHVEVTVGSVEHPMLEAHYIVWILLETTRGWQKKDLKPQEKPAAVFELTEDEKVVAVYEYCNLHGLWKAEA